MEITVKKIAEKARIKSPDLLTRGVGRSLYGELKKAISISAEDEVIVLDFKGVKVIDSSFIDEFIVRMIIDGIESSRKYYVKLRNISQIGQMNIESVFRSYQEFVNKKIVVMTEDICLNNNFFIGDLSQIETDIINYIRINKTAQTGDITSLTGHSREKVEEALALLSRLRVIRKNSSNKYYSV